MPLFNIGNFKLHSGSTANWKIDCDTLTEQDYETLALMASEVLPAYGKVVGIPKGGLLFAKALEKYATPECTRLLIADDVYTTGASMDEEKSKYPDTMVIGVVVFARNEPPHWIIPIWERGC